MAEYIDVEKLKRNIRVNLMPNVDIDGTVTVENAERYFINLIDKTSTADVVEVVRCEKCVWALEPIQEKTIGEELETYHFCKIHNKYFTPDNYCSCGERKVE